MEPSTLAVLPVVGVSPASGALEIVLHLEVSFGSVVFVIVLFRALLIVVVILRLLVRAVLPHSLPDVLVDLGGSELLGY